MTIGKKIETLRLEKKLSQKELATAIGKSTADVALWESDENTPSLSDISKLSKTLNVSIDELLNGVETESESTATESHQADDKNSPANSNKPKRQKTIIILAIVLLVVVAGTVTSLIVFNPFASFSHNTSAIEKAATSVVKIYCYDYDGNEAATGSGFISFDNQTVVTNYHVIEKAYSCKISTDSDKTLEIESVLSYSPEYDVAIIKLKKPSVLDVLTLGNSENMKKGESVTAIGSPLGIKNTVSQGVFSGRKMEESMDVLQFTAEISAGSSGGALFNESGEVIGITYASYTDGQNINLAVPIEKAKELYDNKDKPFQLNEMFLEKYPYVQYLNEYKNVPEVTIEELKANPEQYNDITIKVTAYASSLDTYDLRYITNNKNGVTDNIDTDSNIDSENDFEKTSLLESIGPEETFYDSNIRSGDTVCIIGEFHYYAKGTRIKDFNLFRTTSEGQLKRKMAYIIDSTQ